MRSRVGLLVVLVSMLTVALSTAQAQAAPSASFTDISGPTRAGSTINDVTATFTPSVSGTARFQLYSDAACTPGASVGPAVTAPIVGHAASLDLLLPEPGTYRLAVSAGSAPDYNDELTEDCDTALSIMVAKAQPDIAVSVSQKAVPYLGGFSATAAIKDAFQPGKGIDFDLMDAACATRVTGHDGVIIVGGKATWDVTPPPGSYRVRATYPGDANNASASSCSADTIVVGGAPGSPSGPEQPAGAATSSVQLAASLVDSKERSLLALPRKGTVRFRLSAVNPAKQPVERAIRMSFGGLVPKGKGLPKGLSTADRGKTYTWRGTVPPGKTVLLDMVFRTRKRANIVVTAPADTTVTNVGRLVRETGVVRLAPLKMRAFVPAKTPQIVLSGSVSSATCTGGYQLQIQLRKRLQLAKWSTLLDVPVTVAPVDGRCTLRAVFAIGRKGVDMLNVYRRVEFRVVAKSGAKSNVIAFGITRR